MATASSLVPKLTERLINHTITYEFTAQMCENVYMTLIKAHRDINLSTGSFEKLKSDGPIAYVVIFGEEYQEVKKQLFNYLQQVVETEVKRNDEGITLVVGKEESDRINNGGYTTTTTATKKTGNSNSKKRKICTTESTPIPPFPDLKAII
jgi:hypothetical protein